MQKEELIYLIFLGDILNLPIGVEPLFNRIRIKNNLVYDIHSSINIFYGVITITTSFENSKKDLILKIIQEEINKLQSLKNIQRYQKKVIKMVKDNVIYKKDSKYYPNTRTKEWIKIKNYQVVSFTIGGFSYNDNSNVFSCYLGELKNNKLLFVGKVTIAKKNQLFKTLTYLKTSRNPFNNLSQDFIYVKPKINIKIKYLEKTKNNHLRQPIFIE